MFGMNGAIPLLPYTPSWRGQGKLYLTFPNIGFTRIRPVGVAIIHVDGRTFRN